MARCTRLLKCSACSTKPVDSCPRCKGKGEYICDGIIVGTPPLQRPFCNRCGSQKMMTPVGPAPKRNPGVSHPDDVKVKSLPEGYVEPQPTGGLMPQDVLDSVRGNAVAPSAPTPEVVEMGKKAKTTKTIKGPTDLVA